MSDTSQDQAEDVLIAQADAIIATAASEQEFMQAINIKLSAIMMRVHSIIADVNANAEARK